MKNYADKELLEFIEVMALLAEITAAAKPPSAEAVEFMYGLLREDLPHQLVIQGLKAHSKSPDGKFMPTIADIKKQIGGSSDERAIAAWQLVKKAIERHGYYDSVRFPSPAFHVVIEQMGGWQRLGQEWHSLSEKELEFRGKDFIKLFTLAERTATWENTPAYLPGFFERDNIGKNLQNAIPPIVDVATGGKLERQTLKALTSENNNIIPLFGGESEPDVDIQR